MPASAATDDMAAPAAPRPSSAPASHRGCLHPRDRDEAGPQGGAELRPGAGSGGPGGGGTEPGDDNEVDTHCKRRGEFIVQEGGQLVGPGPGAERVHGRRTFLRSDGLPT